MYKKLENIHQTMIPTQTTPVLENSLTIPTPSQLESQTSRIRHNNHVADGRVLGNSLISLKVKNHFIFGFQLLRFLFFARISFQIIHLVDLELNTV
jgi:hypothetical protein